MSEEKNIASESGHYYYPDGRPAYTIIGKNGKERATTLRECKSLGLFPSVTTVLNILAKPGLERWKLNQVLLSAMTLPINTERVETLDEYAARVIEDAAEQGHAAAERGTQIHGSIERMFQGLMYPPEDAPFVEAILHALDPIGHFEWAAEKSFAATEGYGGKVDLHTASGRGIVIDFKGKDFTRDTPESKLVWPEQGYQLAAYRRGLGLPGAECYSIYFARNTPGLAITYRWPEAKLQGGEEIFMATLKLWKLIKGV